MESPEIDPNKYGHWWYPLKAIQKRKGRISTNDVKDVKISLHMQGQWNEPWFKPQTLPQNYLKVI